MDPRKLFRTLPALLLCAGMLLLPACSPDQPPGTPLPVNTQPPVSASPTASTPTETESPEPSLAPEATATPEAVAVDLGWLAYVENDQVWVVELPAGEPHRLLESPGVEILSLAWSPSTEHLLVTFRDGTASVVNREGSLRQDYADLPQAPFWAPEGVLDQPEEALTLVRGDGTVEVRLFPSQEAVSILPAGSLGADGLATTFWTPEGWLLYTPSIVQLENGTEFTGFLGNLMQPDANGPASQNIAFWCQTPGCPGMMPVSMDYRETYYVPLGIVPGSAGKLLLAGKIPLACVSCTVDGLELVTIDIEFSGKAITTGATLLMTNEAYAWHPGQPGLLAIAGDGGRFLFQPHRLALLDLLAGTQQILSSEGLSVFEPAWSPDGTRIAYVALSAQPNVSGSGADLELSLAGRWISTYPVHGVGNPVKTRPGAGLVDGFPQWVDNDRLIFARKHLSEARTEIRLLGAETGEETLLIEVQNAPGSCHTGGCRWEGLLAYAPPLPESEPVAKPFFTPTLSPVIKPEGALTAYVNPGYGFLLLYPAGWEVDETNENPNFVVLRRAGAVLRFGFRRPTQNVMIHRTGTGAGNFVEAGTIEIAGTQVSRKLLVFEGKVKTVFYRLASEIEVGNLLFTITLDGEGDYGAVDLPESVQQEADEIVRTLQRNP